MVVPLFTTHVEAIGRFLKIYGQTNHNEGLAVEGAIQNIVQKKNLEGSPAASDLSTLKSNIKVGSLCLSKYTDKLYYRCKVIDHEAQDNVLVHFIDYGNDEIISMKDMLSLTDREDPNVEYLLTVSPQAKEYVLAAYWNTHWTEQALSEIRGLIVNEVVKMECYSSVRDYILINIIIEDQNIPDLSQYLIEQRGMGQVIDLRSQRELLMLVVDGLEERDLNMGQVAYTANTLNQHSRYEVLVSHVQDGPFLFCVQLKRELPELKAMMDQLQRVPLREFPTDVLIGMACLVRKDCVYRGVVTLMAATSVIVTLIDFGRTVTVSYGHLYEIPSQFLRQKVFAIRSNIAGYKKLDRYNKQLKQRFFELVTGPQASNLTINVTPLEGSPSLHFCEIFLDSGANVYDELIKVQTKFLELAENEPVPNGYQGEVKITWCHSPARFFVRMLRKESEYQRLAILINEYFEGGTARQSLSEIRIGAICAVKAKEQWYRAEILDIKKTDEGQRTVIVNMVDIGRDVEIGLTLLKRLNYDLSQIPPLSLECALHKVNVTENPGTVAQFNRAIDLQNYPERVYLMKSYTRTSPKTYLVDLLDEGGKVIINQALDGQSPLSLDQYYENVISNGNSEPVVAVEEENQLFVETYVMPLGQIMQVNLVSWVSVDEFYVHLKQQQRSFSEFVQTAQAVPGQKINYSPVPNGTIILAPYSTTDLLYRAEVFDYNQKLHKYKVMFVDIGVRAIIPADQVYENPFLFTSVPKFSHKCCLVDREKLAGNRNPEAVKRIGAIIKEATKVSCTVKERLKGDLNVVRVTIDGKDLLETVCQEDTKIAVLGVGNSERADVSVNNVGKDGGGDVAGSKELNPEMLKNQKLWIKPVDALSKNVFRFSIKDFKSELLKGASEAGTIHMGVFTSVEVVRIENQIYHVKVIKEEILPQLLLENSFSATVSQAPTTILNRLSIQLISSLAPLTRLLLEMRKHYEEDAAAVKLEVLRQCVKQNFAVKAKDGNWYRAELLQVTDSEELLFDMFDYGQRDSIPLANVRNLDLKFRGLNKLATTVYLLIDNFTDKIPTEVVMKEIQSLTRNIALIVKVIENYRGRWIVDIVSNGFYIGQALGEKKLAVSCTMAQVRKQIDREFQETQNRVGEGEPEPVVELRKLEAIEIGHFDSPERIFVQLLKDLPVLKRMQETLQIIAPSLTPVGAAKMGELCIALNSFDGMWYRAKILDSAPDMTSVQFIDYGNTDVITTDKAAKLKQMVDGFASIPEFAKFCSLPMRPGTDRRRTEWDDDVFALLTEYLDKPDKECEFLTETKMRRHFIRLFVQGQDMEQVLKSRGWGESIELIRSGSTCYVSHINSLEEFFLQLDVDATVLDLLHHYFDQADTFESVVEPMVGATYAALYEDEVWYRAKVLKKGARDGEWAVLFIDYGNVAQVTSLKVIASKDIRDIPPLSRKCKLHLPKNVLGVSMEAENLFEEIGQSGATVMTVNLVNMERDYSVVELVVKESGTNVLDMLPLKMNPYESHAEFDQ